MGCLMTPASGIAGRPGLINTQHDCVCVCISGIRAVSCVEYRRAIESSRVASRAMDSIIVYASGLIIYQTMRTLERERAMYHLKQFVDEARLVTGRWEVGIVKP